MDFNQISPVGEGRDTVRVVIETSRGSRNKYHYDPDHGVFTLKKILPEGHVFPFDFGFIPQTRGEDGDPLDVLVMMDAPAFAGCVVECRLIGVLQARQTRDARMVRNDRFIAVADGSIAFRRYRDIGDIEPDLVDQIRHFFVSYNEMEGKQFEVLQLLGAKDADEAVRVAPGGTYME